MNTEIVFHFMGIDVPISEIPNNKEALDIYVRQIIKNIMIKLHYYGEIIDSERDDEMEYFAIKCVELCIFCNITNFTLIFPPVTDYYKDERLTDIYRDKRLALMAYFMSYMQKNEELFN